MTCPIPLPATPEDFTAYQERLIHRKLSAAEREATAVWLDIFNNIRTGNLDGAVAKEKIGYLIATNTDDDILHFLKAAREWIVYAGEGVTEHG